MKHRRLDFAAMSSWIVRASLLAAVNLLAGKLALLLAIPPGYATALWPPSGMALAAVLLWGYRVLPGVFIGSFLTNVDIGQENVASSVLVATGIGLASTLQAAVGTFLVRRFVGFPNPLVGQRDILIFFILGGPVACLIAPTISVGIFWTTGTVFASNIAFTWWTWWVGDSIGVLIFTPLVLILFGSPRAIWARRKNTVAIPLVIVVTAVSLLFVYFSSRESQRRQLEFNERCRRLGDELTTQLDRYQEVMWSIALFFESSEHVTRDEFYRFTAPTVKRLRGLHALSWNPKVLPSTLVTFEESVRSEGFPHFRVTERDASGAFVPVLPRREYFPVEFIVPLERNLAALGYDVASDAMRVEALDQAAAVGEASATRPVNLVQDKEMRNGVLLFIPVFASRAALDTVEDRRRSLRGYAVGVFRIDDVVDEALSGVQYDSSGIEVRIIDATLPGVEQNFYTGRWSVSSERLQSPLIFTMSYPIGGRNWILQLRGAQENVAPLSHWHAWMVDAVGLGFAALLGLFLLILDGRAVERETINAKLHEAVNARDEFLSIASHELRTPLTPLKLQLQSLLRMSAKETESTDAQDRFRRRLQVIYGQVDRLIRLVDELLDTSRISVGRLVLERQCVDVRQIVIDVLERHDKELRRASIIAKLDAPEPVTAHLDPLRMGQVITNLLTNAIKYAPEKPLHISIAAAHGHMVLIMRDEGPGIADKDLARIFERFERVAMTGRQQGLGLGLYIVRQIVDAHGGTIRAESERGRGTSFIVEIPLFVGDP